MITVSLTYIEQILCQPGLQYSIKLLTKLVLIMDLLSLNHTCCASLLNTLGMVILEVLHLFTELTRLLLPFNKLPHDLNSKCGIGHLNNLIMINLAF